MHRMSRGERRYRWALDPGLEPDLRFPPSLPAYPPIQRMPRLNHWDVDHELCKVFRCMENKYRYCTDSLHLRLTIGHRGFVIKSINAFIRFLVGNKNSILRRFRPESFLPCEITCNNTFSERHAEWALKSLKHRRMKALVRILKDLRNGNKGLRSLKPWMMDLLANSAFTKTSFLNDYFRVALRMPSSGSFLSTLMPRHVRIEVSPCGHVEPHFFREAPFMHTNPTHEDGSSITAMAQTLLQVLSQGGHRQVLEITDTSSNNATSSNQHHRRYSRLLNQAPIELPKDILNIYTMTPEIEISVEVPKRERRLFNLPNSPISTVSDTSVEVPNPDPEIIYKNDSPTPDSDTPIEVPRPAPEIISIHDSPMSPNSNTPIKVPRRMPDLISIYDSPISPEHNSHIEVPNIHDSPQSPEIIHIHDSSVSSESNTPIEVVINIHNSTLPPEENTSVEVPSPEPEIINIHDSSTSESDTSVEVSSPEPEIIYIHNSSMSSESDTSVEVPRLPEIISMHYSPMSPDTAVEVPKREPKRIYMHNSSTSSSN